MDRKLLKSLILEEMERMLNEQDDNEMSEKTRLSRDSVDDQIDSFILKFESQSVVDKDENDDTLEALEEMSLRTFLLEQEEDEEPEGEDAPEEAAEAEDEEDKEGDEESDMEKSADMGDVDEVEDVPKPKLNINDFTKRVARLALNAETLLDVKSVIVKRAQNFLNENYDGTHVEEMLNILNAEFDFDLDGEDSLPETPYAVGAYAGGTGGLGGGGGG